MVSVANGIGKKKELTQHGLNTLLWKLVRDCGGKIVIKHAELMDLPDKAVLAVDYDASSDSFCVRIGRVNESPIIGGSEILVQN